MARLPDLVRDSQLDVELRDGCLVHAHFESSHAFHQRAILREETWKPERHIGGGASGSVWLETCTSGRQKGAVRAVKKIPLRPVSARDAVYIRELEAIAKFSHPKYERCFVQSFGWYESLGSFCIAMEYCGLGDLQGYLSSAPPLPEIQAQEITFQMLEGVRYMHENEFAHRDLKPNNILIKSQPPGSWWIKIADFGISKRVEESLGTPSTVKGTPQFMAPELRGLTAAHSISNGSASTNPYAADMWSLGEIAFQILTKQPAFPELFQLIQYVQGSRPFPNALLAQFGVSSCGQQFISSTMLPSTDSRLKAAQAWNHEWMEKCKTSYLSPRLATETRISRGEELPAVSVVDSLTEWSATWSSVSECGPRTQALIPPFMSNYKSQVDDSLSSEECFLLRTLKGHEGNVTAVAFSPNSRLLASASIDTTIRLWDADSGAPLRTLEGHTNSIWAITFSPNSRLLASASLDTTIRLWDVGSRAPLRTLKGHDFEVGDVAFSPNGKLLASASGDKTIRLWDTDSGAPLRTLKEHEDHVGAVAFSPNGKLLASASDDGTIRLWDADSGVPLRTLKEHESMVWAVAFSPNGKLLASAACDGTIRLWDADSVVPLRTLKGHEDHVHAVAFSPNGKLLASALEVGLRIFLVESAPSC